LTWGDYLSDTFETYVDGANADSLWGGQNGNKSGYIFFWTTRYATRNNAFGEAVRDDFETYSDGENVNGLNGGTNGQGVWAAAWVGR
jgi:hypothetical protein